MKIRALRYTLFTVFVGLYAGVGYVIWCEESEGRAAADAVHAFDERVRAASRALLDTRSSQSGYVAAGQGEDYWAVRVDALLASARQALTGLQAEARTAQGREEVGTAAQAFADFEQMDRRARNYARNGQRLLASDLVFSDGLEKMDAALGALDRARESELAAGEALVGESRRRQLMAMAGAAAGGLLVLFLLTPLPREAPAAVPAPVRDVPESLPLNVPVSRPEAASPPAPDQAPAVAPVPPAPAMDLPAIAALCTDLARVFDITALPAALERAAVLLNASGIVVWVADPDARELAPIVAHGYPRSILTRMGTIDRDAENVTAAAFRTGLVQTVNSDHVSHGAIAAPLVTPAGPVGVMAAEVLDAGERKDETLAIAVIVAAQLATLMGPPSTRAHGTAEAAGAGAG